MATGKQVIFDGFTTYNNNQAARYGAGAQKREAQRTADEVVFTVTEAFYRLIKAKEKLKGAQEAYGSGRSLPNSLTLFSSSQVCSGQEVRV